MNTPSIVMMSKFRSPRSTRNTKSGKAKIQYNGFVDYMDRQDAKEALEVQRDVTHAEYQPDWTGESTVQYLGNPYKTNNTFNDKSYSLNVREVREIKDAFDIAQGNMSPLWQTVFSFDNNFLKSQGHLSEDGILNDVPLKDAARRSMSRFIKEMEFNETVEWVGALHYNTDNIHIHIALVEKESSREIILGGEYDGERKAKVPAKVLKHVKSDFVNTLVDRTQELTQATHIARNKIRQPMEQLKLRSEIEVRKELGELIYRLPENRTLWKYNMNALNNVRPLIDRVTAKLTKKYFMPEFQMLKNYYLEEKAFRESIYGKGKEDYFENQMSVFKASLGNALLKELKNEFPKTLEPVKQPDIEREQQTMDVVDDSKMLDSYNPPLESQKTVDSIPEKKEAKSESHTEKKEIPKSLSGDNREYKRYKSPIVKKKTLNRIKKSLMQTTQDYLNASRHREIERDRERHEQYGQSL